MTSPVNPAALTIARALDAAGLIAAGKLEAVAAVVAAALPRGGPALNFKVDAEFLHTCLDHHVETYFRQVLEPIAQAHHARYMSGRLMKDDEIEAAAIDLTTQVVRELGGGYVAHLGQYFGNDIGLTTYVFSRIHARLVGEAARYNAEYLAALSRRRTVARLTAPDEHEKS